MKTEKNLNDKRMLDFSAKDLMVKPTYIQEKIVEIHKEIAKENDFKILAIRYKKDGLTVYFKLWDGWISVKSRLITSYHEN